MPDCADCRRLRDDGQCGAFPKEWPLRPVNRLRVCSLAIVEEYCSLITSETRVLEIGCGTLSLVRDHCQRVRAVWEGVDVSAEYLGQPTIATRLESVEFLSVPDEAYDLVVGTQTLEHWDQNGVRPAVGLWECFRACRPGGLVCMNVPVGLHGSREFLEGDLEAIAGLFHPFATDVTVEAWGRNREPMEPLKLVSRRFAPAGSFIADIRAWRNPGPLPERPSPYRIRSRRFREFAGHRLHYALWRLGHRLGRLIGRPQGGVAQTEEDA